MENEIVNVPATVSLSNVQVYDRISNPMDAVKQMGSAIFKSGLFGLDRPEQGEVLAMQCLVERKSPLELARTYHFIQGQLAIRSDALLAKFQQAGGAVDWTTRTDTEVAAVFHYKGRQADIKATLKEYTDNGTALGRDGKLKDNWKRWPRRMLTARAISEGVRLLAPECCFGTYTVEEYDVTSTATNGSVPKMTTLEELVVMERRPAALRVLSVKSFEDVPKSIVDGILRKPAPFLNAVEKEIAANGL